MMCGMCCECAVISDASGVRACVRLYDQSSALCKKMEYSSSANKTLGKRPKASARPEGQARAEARPLGALPRFAAEALGPWHAGGGGGMTSIDKLAIRG